MGERLAGGVDEFPEQDGQGRPGIEISVDPLLDIPCRDLQESWHIGTDREALFLGAHLAFVEPGLHLKKLLLAGAEGFLDPERHLGGEGGFAVQEVGQRRATNTKQLSSGLHGQAGRSDVLLLDVEARMNRSGASCRCSHVYVVPVLCSVTGYTIFRQVMSCGGPMRYKCDIVLVHLSNNRLI